MIGKKRHSGLRSVITSCINVQQIRSSIQNTSISHAHPQIRDNTFSLRRKDNELLTIHLLSLTTVLFLYRILRNKNASAQSNVEKLDGNFVVTVFWCSKYLLTTGILQKFMISA
jgi:hypothetical protein